MKTIAVDFDGVIHKYSKGWQDGSIYDKPVKDAFSAIGLLFDAGYTVFIFSTRSPREIKRWMRYYSNPLLYMTPSDFMDQYFPMQEMDDEIIQAEYSDKSRFQFRCEIIPFWKKFWNKENVLGITKRKLPAHVYVDDRALKFEGDWWNTVDGIQFFKTYQHGKS